MGLEAGQDLLHYRLAEKIGEGGMGVVWKATDTTLGREVAIKILPPDFASDEDRLARFDREARLLASLNHPNIAGIYGTHKDKETHFLAMEPDIPSRLDAFNAGSRGRGLLFDSGPWQCHNTTACLEPTGNSSPTASLPPFPTCGPASRDQVPPKVRYGPTPATGNGPVPSIVNSRPVSNGKGTRSWGGS